MTPMPLIRNLLPALALALLTALLPAAAMAQPSTNFVQRLLDLEKAVAALSQTTKDQQARLSAQDERITAQANTIANQASSIATLNAALTKEVADRVSYADARGAQALADAKSYSDNKLAPMADKLVHFSRVGNEVYIRGANLNIQNGKGTTYAAGVNGLGNLIVGYNELRNNAASPDVRLGSHNLVLGQGNNFSQTGAILTGINNASTAHFASVLGGTGNSANAYYSVVVGGYNNNTNGGWSTILGGRDRTAANQLDHLP